MPSILFRAVAARVAVDLTIESIFSSIDVLTAFNNASSQSSALFTEILWKFVLVAFQKPLNDVATSEATQTKMNALNARMAAIAITVGILSDLVADF